SFDLVMNAQTATNYSMDTAIQRAHPDSIEIEGYTYSYVNSFANDTALWQPAMVEPYERMTNPSDIYNFYQSVHDYQSQKSCGASGTATCNVNIYEWGQGTISGSIDQTHMDYINAGAGEGVVMALQPLLTLQYYGIGAQSFFSLTEFRNGAANGLVNKLWGNVIDMGGATNNVRPEFLGVQLVNQSIIGSMYSCPIANNLTFNFAGSPNGITAMPALNNVPYLYAFCFENGTKRSLVLINTDLSASHTIGFSGTNPPQGTVTQRQYAPAALDDMNEAHSGSVTNLAPATVAIETSTLSSPGSITLPPYSATALDYTTTGQATAATPTFTPAAGSYTSTQTVTISDATSGTTIYYTTNGATPTTSSSVYSGPITVSATETIEAIAVATGYVNSAVATATYTINTATVLPAPTFSPVAGTYSTSQTVTISDATSGTTIYYTTNGTTPTTSSSVYSGPITVSATETIEAIAVETGYTNSGVATAAYTINTATVLPVPTFSPAAGTYSTSQTVTISDATSGATIYYTTNGTTPTTSSSVYTGPITVSVTETLETIAVETGYTNSAVATAAYTINTATVLPAPTFSPVAGTYSTSQTVTISDATNGTTIYYTTNGTAPTTSSTKYTGPITVSVTETLEAIAVETGYTNSPAATAAYTIDPVLPAPTFSPAPGTYISTQTVTIGDATNGTTIYYTTNGTTPTTSSSVYSGPITVSATETLEAIAVETGYANSAVATAAYTINTATAVAAPVFSPTPGTYTSPQSVTISDATNGAAIYYTIDGSTPSASSTRYMGAIWQTATQTLKAIAVETGYSNSPVTTAAYTIAPVLPAPTFSPQGGGASWALFTAPPQVTLSDTQAGVTFYYTTNGATPTTSSTLYTGPITVNVTETIEAIAVESGYTNSPMSSMLYTIAPVLPAPAFSLAAGTYSTSQTVTISDATAGTTIYYTTNGTTPTTSSTKYTGTITVGATETLEAIAVESGYCNSPAASAAYTINNGSLTGQVVDFSIRSSTPSATAAPDGSAAFVFTVTPLSQTTIFPSAVSLSASGLPANATYSFSPATIPEGAGTTALTLTVRVPQTVAKQEPLGRIGGVLASHMAPTALGLLLLPFAGRLRKTGRRLKRSVFPLLLLVAAMSVVTGLAGCTSGNSILQPAQQAHTYTVTVVGTTGTLSESATVTLTVD
ncbi:MAG: chitobiase/beta-hexosaminidase C-terminal domain-containing protein, partial [Terracidiphilus sp.]